MKSKKHALPFVTNVRTAHLISFLFFMMSGKSADAIPSPELVIGSVTSLSQVLAIGFASVSGAGALIARRMGFQINNTKGKVRYPVRLISVLSVLILALGVLSAWSFKSAKDQRQQHLQATLTRPAQFTGTQIQDANLKETSFVNQGKSTLSITTQTAQQLLMAKNENTLFFDVRETAEHQMGTLPNAAHVRFPDFANANLPLTGKKVVLFCHNGNRSSEICGDLAALGIDCRFIAGGIEKWIVEKRPFSDQKVETLSDLRAIPEFINRDTLLGTKDFKNLLGRGGLQIVDTRYPGDFATGHLPGAINIPIRALSSNDLAEAIDQLDIRPTVAACYDRRSCFMSQVLGYELAQKGIEFQGRYTTPWEYFIPPTPKPHVQEWLDTQQKTVWQKTVGTLAGFLAWIDQRSHFIFGILVLSIFSRILVLPIALKSERDQLVSAQHSSALDAIKTNLADDPIRKSRAIQSFYAEHGITPVRNLTALLFLPIMMLGLSAVEMASTQTRSGFLWLTNLSAVDKTFLLPSLFALFAGIYLHWTMAKTTRQALLWWAIGAPIMFALVFRLSAAGNIYLCSSLVLLLAQRAYVTGLGKTVTTSLRKVTTKRRQNALPLGVIPLSDSARLVSSGNKSYRLSVLQGAGVPVPNGVVINTSGINQYNSFTEEQRQQFGKKLWDLIGKKTCAVRSSSAREDGDFNSFAGVFESVLDVDEQNMCEAIETVIKSFSAKRVGSYDIGTDDVADGNILIQHMVQSDYAGVLFTQDPTAAGLMMLEMVAGTADDLVSGRVTPQSLRYGRFTHTPIEADTSPIDMNPLLEMGSHIETVFGCPQDIEWVYLDGAFQIVQSRDITALSSQSPAERVRFEEWDKLLTRYRSAAPDHKVLEQDEMSEVLMRSTPISLSLMGSVWAPGGSLDLASRQLAIPYKMPEGALGHLVSVFGRTFVDTGLKQKMALRLSKAKTRQLDRLSQTIGTAFRSNVIPELRKDMRFWSAVDFSVLSQAQIIDSIEKLRFVFVQSVYVEAEKINLLAAYTMNKALQECQDDKVGMQKLMTPDLTHAPTNLLGGCAVLDADKRQSAALKMMGHRAIFDYELSVPRYNETPDMLWPLLDSAEPKMPLAVENQNSSSAVDIAIELQDLKEQAKHEAVRIIAQLRRALIALGGVTGLNELVFYLDLNEVASLSDETQMGLMQTAQVRKDRSEIMNKMPSVPVRLTLHDLEKYSLNDRGRGASEGGSMYGTCVSGSCSVSGTVFVVEDEFNVDSSAFDGFQIGDIIVCRMVNPAWLPFVQQAGAVLSEVGGFLSHMSIVAREKDILMLVACSGLDTLTNGMRLDVTTDGAINPIKPQEMKIKRSA